MKARALVVGAVALFTISVVAGVAAFLQRGKGSESAAADKPERPVWRDDDRPQWASVKPAEVTVPNGQAALAEMPEGVAFVVPHLDVYWPSDPQNWDDPPRFSVTAKVIYSRSGDLAKDAVTTFDGDVPDNGVVKVGDWELQVRPRGEEATIVRTRPTSLYDVKLRVVNGTRIDDVDLGERAGEDR